MRAVIAIAGIATACLAGLALWQLGTEEERATPTEAERTAVPTETAERLPKLPRGWTTTANGQGGFALGVPPGWSARNAAARTTLTAPDRSVVVRVTADRTDEALDAELGAFVRQVAEAIEPGAPVRAISPPPAAAPGYEVAGVSVRRGRGGRQGVLEVFVVRRTGLASYPILVAGGRGVMRSELDPIARRIVGSLRGRPVGGGG